MKKSLAAFLVLISVVVYSQKIKLTEGNLDFLETESSIAVKMIFKNITVGAMSEKDYVAKKKVDFNEAEPGKGDDWVISWFDSREQLFKPVFLRQFAQQSGREVKPDAKYTMVFKTVFIEPGFNVPVTPVYLFSLVSGEVIFLETQNGDKVLARITVLKIPGKKFPQVYDFDSVIRIQSSYENAGHELGRFVRLKTR